MRLFISALLLTFSLNAAQPLAESRPIHEAFVQRNRADVLPIPVSGIQPPAAFPEKVPPQRTEGTVWIPGYWAWIEESQSYEWVCGVWRRPPPNHVWVPGTWIQANGGYAYLQGFWSEEPLASIQFISEAPPEDVDETVPDAPGENFFYARGYWDHSSGQYQWLQGSWVPFDPNWVLTFARYVWRPEGYIFLPAHWDYALQERGDAYFCEGNSEKFERVEPQVIVETLYVYYPDYIPIYWHWWHFHPGFWDGCGCMPPWWGWHGWWGLGWHDQWALWWWWGHPGFPAPVWLSPEMGLRIGPPREPALQIFRKAHTPFFITPNGVPHGKKWHDRVGPYLPKNPKELDSIKDSIGNTLPKGEKIRPEGKGKERAPQLPKFPSKETPGRGKITPPTKPKLPPSISPKPTEDKKPGFIPPKGEDRGKLPKQPDRFIPPPTPHGDSGSKVPQQPDKWQDKGRITPPIPDEGKQPSKPRFPHHDQPQYEKPGFVTPSQPEMPSDRGRVTPPQPQMPPDRGRITPSQPDYQPKGSRGIPQDQPRFDKPSFVNPPQPQMPPPDKGRITPPQPNIQPQGPVGIPQDQPRFDKPGRVVNPEQRQQFDDRMKDRMRGHDNDGK